MTKKEIFDKHKSKFKFSLKECNFCNEKVEELLDILTLDCNVYSICKKCFVGDDDDKSK